MSRLGYCIAFVAASALLVVWPAGARASGQPQTDPFVHSVSLATPASESSELYEALGAAAEDGDVEAMNLLGVLFVTNAKVASDHSMALYWFQRAVDAGSADGMVNLATMYLRGLGVSRDYANALRWFQRAAAAGHAQAMFSVAVMAEHGLGAARDLPLARRMYRKAAEAGIPLAMLWLSDDLGRDGADRDLVEAYAWLEVAGLAQIDGQLHLVVLGRIEQLGARLGAAERDRAHSRASQIVADMRARTAPVPAPNRSSPATKRALPSA